MKKLSVTFEYENINFTCEVQREGYIKFNSEPGDEPTYDIDIIKVEPNYRIGTVVLAELLKKNSSKIESEAINVYESDLSDYMNDVNFSDDDSAD